jgi:hypothetical protein
MLCRRDRYLSVAAVRGIDIHHNEISAMTDDGIELDYSERNVRCFSNRLTDVYQGHLHAAALWRADLHRAQCYL